MVRVVIGVAGGGGIMVVAVVVTALAVITLVKLLYLDDGCGCVVYGGGFGCELEMGERRTNLNN